MTWLERVISWMFYQFGATTIITVGSLILTLLIVIPIAYFESKIRKEKDE